MVYIFFVQHGTMMTFPEISIMQSVEDLQQKIADKTGVAVEHQVLLISGGEALNPTKPLCSYVAGTDSNPIYLFSLHYNSQKLTILSDLTYDDQELLQRLQESLSLPVQLSTVKVRTIIAQDFLREARIQYEFCETLVNDQHLQQQGWRAAIANLEDIVTDFRKRWELFSAAYDKFIKDRVIYEECLSRFTENKEILRRIPVIDPLLESQSYMMYASKLADSTIIPETEPSKEISLYDWLCLWKPEYLEKYYDSTVSNLEKFDQQSVNLIKDVNILLQSVEQPERKEIEGLGKRLYGLGSLLEKMKKCVESQSDMAQSFMQNQTSASNMKDVASAGLILPELCATHVQQIGLIKDAHTKLIEDRSKIIKAKNELSISLCNRLGWVQNIEDKIHKTWTTLTHFNGFILRMHSLLNLFQQVHMAPKVYMSAVAEVVRRRAFSQMFLTWSSALACQQLTIYNEEVSRRKEFNSMVGDHFLKNLFLGLDDIPPAFAIEAPETFDEHLAKISNDEVERLRTEFPEYGDMLIVPDLSHVIDFFSKSLEDKEKATPSHITLQSAPGCPTLKDDKGCESETDTEEYEKVGQSPIELTFSQGATGAEILEKIDASTSTEVQNQILLPPKKPPRSFRTTLSFESESAANQRTLSISTNESFTNVKNISLESIDELSSMNNFSSTDSCFNSHYNQNKDQPTSSNLSTSMYLSDNKSATCLMLGRSKSVSPQSPRDGVLQFLETSSPQSLIPNSYHQHHHHGHHQTDFSTDEFYIDESLPSSVDNSQGSEFVRQLDTANIVVAMLQDNLQISRSEHDQLRSMFRSMSVIAKSATQNLRADLDAFRSQFLDERLYLSKQYEDLGSSWETLLIEVDRNEKELVDTVTKSHQSEKDDLRYTILDQQQQIHHFTRDRKEMEERMKQTCEQLKTLEDRLNKETEENDQKVEGLVKQLREKDEDKEKSLKELSDRLKLEHRAEIDNIKSRFKLMNMEKSSSLSSLEKEKLQGDLPEHTLAQMTEQFASDKQKAINEVRQQWEKVLQDKINEMQQQFEVEREFLRQELSQTLCADKDNQIDILVERTNHANLDIAKCKTMIQQLTVREDELLEEIECLKCENQEIRAEMDKVNKEKEEATKADKTDENDSTSSSSDKLLQSMPKLSPTDEVNIDKCTVGRVVAAFWDHYHKCFRILQVNPKNILYYFVLVDCLPAFEINFIDGMPNKYCFVGEVTEKSLCQISKNQARYNLSIETLFYGIKLKPTVISNPNTLDESMSESVAPAKSSRTGAKTFAQDSGIVLNVELAQAALGDDPNRVELTRKMTEKEKRLKSEIRKYKTAIKQLTDSIHLDRVELAKARSEKQMSASAVVTSTVEESGKMEVSTVPINSIPTPQEDLSKSESSSKSSSLSTKSCHIGDIVLVHWDELHGNFLILQEKVKLLHFLHAECLESLGLSVSDGNPNKLRTVGEVVDKESCKAVKPSNRYKVPKGTKFNRVKVKPVETVIIDESLIQSTSRRLANRNAISTFDPLLEEPQPSSDPDVSNIQVQDPQIETSSISQQASQELVSNDDDASNQPTSSIKISGNEVKDTEKVDDEEAKAAIENSDQRFDDGSYDDDDDDDDERGTVGAQSTYVNTNWLEAMFRSMFSK